jgi:GDP-L-fucose synthase
MEGRAGKVTPQLSFRERGLPSGYGGEIVQDLTKPDGTPRKLLDVSKLHGLGWKHRIELHAGVESTYRWFLENQDKFRR